MQRGVTFLLTWVAVLLCGLGPAPPCAGADEAFGLKAGIASRDITPDGPIWLSGYASRNHASEKVAQPLQVGAVAFEDRSGQRLVLVALDNCEVNREYTAPVLDEIQKSYG